MAKGTDGATPNTTGRKASAFSLSDQDGNVRSPSDCKGRRVAPLLALEGRHHRNCLYAPKPFLIFLSIGN